MVSDDALGKIKSAALSQIQFDSLKSLSGNRYKYKWLFDEALAGVDDSWRLRPDTGSNKAHNKELRKTYEMLHRLFRSES